MTEITWIGKHQHVAYNGVKWYADPEGRWREVFSLNTMLKELYQDKMQDLIPSGVNLLSRIGKK